MINILIKMRLSAFVLKKNNHVECSRLLNDELFDLESILNAKRY